MGRSQQGQKQRHTRRDELFHMYDRPPVLQSTQKPISSCISNTYPPRQKPIAHGSFIPPSQAIMGFFKNFPPSIERKVHLARRSHQRRDRVHLRQACRRGRAGEIRKASGAIAGHSHTGSGADVHSPRCRRRGLRSRCERAVWEHHFVGSWWESL